MSKQKRIDRQPHKGAPHDPWSSGDRRRAQREIDAWLCFTGLDQLVNEFLFTLRFAPIPFDRVLIRCEATTRKDLEAHIEKAIPQDSDLAHVALVPGDFTTEDGYRMKQEPGHELKLKRDKERRRLKDCLAPIARRKEHWSLLGYVHLDALRSAIRETFPETAKAIIKKGELDMTELEELVLRKMRLMQNRTKKANARTSADRSKAAKRGWKTRKAEKA